MFCCQNSTVFHGLRCIFSCPLRQTYYMSLTQTSQPETDNIKRLHHTFHSFHVKELSVHLFGAFVKGNSAKNWHLVFFFLNKSIMLWNFTCFEMSLIGRYCAHSNFHCRFFDQIKCNTKAVHNGNFMVVTH